MVEIFITINSFIDKQIETHFHSSSIKSTRIRIIKSPASTKQLWAFSGGKISKYNFLIYQQFIIFQTSNKRAKTIKKFYGWNDKSRRLHRIKKTYTWNQHWGCREDTHFLRNHFEWETEGKVQTFSNSIHGKSILSPHYHKCKSAPNHSTPRPIFGFDSKFVYHVVKSGCKRP